ncbi:aldo/keto reductase [Mucilaginibacter sp. SP1R1]|uniref:aldo/keto reductase n=1 Tax=Mucilaginibacter sp. SP1R1 TaxID=2723091 RepID=UPI00160A168D|nr:aldo/keto reductase [Mucilaginibacter sp. SP1R1]MBB6150900.1 aryl-alcohol dehydrogenase-like predicted oxidoreductase [Mucilaginibacter sp. SP1R1]
MEYRKLGNTNLKLSAITYGAFAIGGNMWGGNEEQESIKAIQASIDHDVTTIDTAPFYGFGLSEELVGKAIAGYDRSKIQLLTKFGLVWDNSNNGKGEFFFDAADDNGNKLPVYKYAAKNSIIREVEASLKRLGTDYIDLLQIHWPDATTPIAETMDTLALLIKQGKIRAAGVSNYNLEQIQTASQTIELASNQVPYSMLNRAIEQDVVPYAQQNNMGIIAYSPLERGLLTGKYKPDFKLSDTDHRNGYFNQFSIGKVNLFLEAIRPLASQKEVSLSQLVLRWTTLQPGITVVLAGARNTTQAIDNAKAVDFTLNAEDLAFINQTFEGIFD